MLVFIIQMIRGKSWTDLLVVVGVFSILLITLTAFVPGWIIVGLIITAHVLLFSGALVYEMKRKKQVPPTPPINK